MAKQRPVATAWNCAYVHYGHNVTKQLCLAGFTMKSIAAKDAKNHFGEMLDTVQREPLIIEKHGRAVAVVMSAQDYQQMKLERLRAKLAVGEAQLNKGEYADYSLKGLIDELDREEEEDQKQQLRNAKI